MSGGDRAAARIRRDAIALLKLAGSAPHVRSEDGVVVATSGGGRERRLSAPLVSALVSDGALRRTDGRLERTPEGTARLRRLLAGEGTTSATDAHASQHRDVGRTVLQEGGTRWSAAVNRAESALGRLARMDEGRFLHPELREAGERLRSDFERGQLQPSLTTNWSGSGGAPGGSRGSGDLTDAAMAARRRFERARAALAGELRPATVDLCCFDKGLTDIERERGWPKRSAKIMLRAGLEQLAGHYRAPREGRA